MFATLEKFNNGHMSGLPPPQIKQIAGRAGRFRVAGVSSDTTSSNEVGGTVTTLKRDHIPILHDSISTPNPNLTHAMLWPPYRVFEKFTQQFPVGTPLSTMITHFAEVSKTARHYRSIESDAQIALAEVIDDLPDIDLESRYNISFAPVKTQAKEQLEAFTQFANAFSEGRPVTIESPSLDLPLSLVDKMQKRIEAAEVMTASKLHTLETLHKIITCYCWLS